MANELRGNMDAAEFKNYILAFMFYRYLSEHQGKASLNHKIDEAQIIPSDYQTIFDNFNKNAELNAEASRDFRGIFNDINLGDSRLGSSTTASAKSLNSIVKLVDSLQYKGEDGENILGEVYEYLSGQFAASAKKRAFINLEVLMQW